MEKMNAKVQTVLKNKKMLWALGGLGLLLLFNPLAFLSGEPKGQKKVTGEPQTVVTNDSRTAMQEYERLYEQRLTEILSTVRGVSEPSVMVTIDSSEEIVYAMNQQSSKQQNQESDTKGGTRGTTSFDESGNIVMTKQNGSDKPLIVKTIKPRVRGVVVTAKGAEDVKIQSLITEAVQRALEVPPHKISILPKKPTP
jgi:stage III sporulation protein AG